MEHVVRDDDASRTAGAFALDQDAFGWRLLFFLVTIVTFSGWCNLGLLWLLGFCQFGLHVVHRQ